LYNGTKIKKYTDLCNKRTKKLNNVAIPRHQNVLSVGFY
jgi:hypothetical protein